MTSDYGLNFDKKPPKKCDHCGKPKHDHKAESFHCPRGKKHRVYGYTSFSLSYIFKVKT